MAETKGKIIAVKKYINTFNLFSTRKRGLGKLISRKNIFIFCLILLASTAFSVAWSGTELDINSSSAKSIVGIQATINYSGADLNAVCFNTTNSIPGSTSNCYETEAATGLTIPLTSTLTGISSDGNYTLYAFLVQDDGNYSSSSNESVKIDSTAPTYTIFPADGGDYNYVTFIFDINFSDASAVTSLIKLDTSQTITDGSPLSNLGEGTHTITIDANDSLGNQMTQGTATFRVDTNKPTSISASSSYSSSYTSDEAPDITLSATDTVSGLTGGKARLSCGTSFANSYEVNLTGTSTTISDFNIISSSYDCNSADGNKAIYAKFRDKAGNWTTTYATTNIMYDNTNPDSPMNLTAIAGNNSVALEWDAPSSADNLSGNAGYRIYKRAGSGSYSVYASTTSTSYSVSSLANGTTYCFAISAYDNAGNEGDQGSEQCTTPQSVTTSIVVKRGNTEVSYAKDNDALDISCTFSESTSGALIKIKYYSASTETIKTASGSVTNISDSIVVASGYTSLQLWCETSGVSSSTKTITIDNTAPSAKWLDNNNTFTGTKRIIVEVIEAYIDKVEFVLNSVTYTTTKQGDRNYYADINSKTINNDSYTLKAVAYDLAGNKTELSKTITVSNILSTQQVAQKAINDATTKKKVVEDTIKFLNEQGISINAELSAKKSEADDFLAKAKADMNANDLNKAKAGADQAKESYNSINISLTTETTDTQTYTLTQGNIEAVLTQLGFSAEEAQKAEQDSTNNARKLTIMHIGSGNEYQVTIEITVKNDTNEGRIKIVEIIPKELTQSAKQIFSDTNFVILQEDPIIEFEVDVASGETKTITYGTGIITKEKADELKTINVVTKFSSQPILMSTSADTETIVQKSNMTNLAILIGGTILVIIIILVIGFFGMQALNSGHGFGGEKTATEIKKEDNWPKK